MTKDNLQIFHKPQLAEPVMLIGLSGWMDSGSVSTGTVEYVNKLFSADEFARLKSDDFYIQCFPGTMEFSALFRPEVTITDGLIENLDFPQNVFSASKEHDFITFQGKEPNLHWDNYTDCLLAVARQLNVRRICFVASVAGLTPHTREPRIFFSASNKALRDQVHRQGLKYSNYEGPGSIITYLTTRCSSLDIELVSIIAETPAYVQGYNPRCIETAVRAVSLVLNKSITLDGLVNLGDEFEKKLSSMVDNQPELAKTVAKLEQSYDDEVFDTEMGDLKQWLEEKGIRLE